jgi:uncharacterized protein (DUF1015 family)
MAEIAPLRAVLFDPSRVAIDKVIAPPYDVIDATERKRLAGLEAHNIVHLDLPEGEGDARYDNAAKLYAAWQADGSLKRDQRWAIFVYNQSFTIPELPGRKFTRRGVICGVRLARYDEQTILPHERTLRGPKEDRLKLMRATQAHFSQIFGLYRDPSNIHNEAFGHVEDRAADLEGRTADGTLHQLWRITDRERIRDFARTLMPLPFYIADGHHRYETMLALRDELAAKAPGGLLGPRASPQFATFFLSNLVDPGLVILPTHRLVHSLAKFDAPDFLARAGETFQITTLENGRNDVTELKRVLHELGTQRPSVAVVLPGSDTAWVLSLAHDPYLDVHRAVARLDVTLLHSVLLEKLLGIDQVALAEQKNITYVKDTTDAVARVARGEAQIGFLMNPTRAEQVLDVANAHQTMPQKSTFFVPKIASGLVINPLDPDEDLDRAW